MCVCEQAGCHDNRMLSCGTVASLMTFQYFARGGVGGGSCRVILYCHNDPWSIIHLNYNNYECE